MGSYTKMLVTFDSGRTNMNTHTYAQTNMHARTRTHTNKQTHML